MEAINNVDKLLTLSHQELIDLFSKLSITELNDLLDIITTGETIND